MDALELWGGVECTTCRIGDSYSDHVCRSGHQDRIEDLDRFASLGLKALRYPVLWERVARDGLDLADWRWTDARLGRLRDLGVRPIVGLLHHGSGPPDTNLLDPAFPERIARYAAAVAQRYPWVQDYTPVNEPLTTARFSALYGHWYPHRCDERSFVAALLHQVRGIVLSMRAIREVNPHARLVQTEDTGRTDSRPCLKAQAEFEKHRRWLTYDLLCRRVIPGHPLWQWLLAAGASQADLEWLAAHACPPEIVGLNYYVTSDRYLDERIAHYPAWSHGGNGRQTYADVEAVRAIPDGLLGHRRALLEAWTRYGRPVALTEVHLGASREDQMRWLLEAWTAAEDARAAGADIRAVTVWALLGCFDWNSLLVRTDGCYEPGAFDIRSVPPRETAVAALARALAAGTVPDPIAGQPGWWARPERIRFGPVAAQTHRPTGAPAIGRRPLLVTGARGTLGSALSRAAASRGLNVAALSRRDLDITDEAAVARVLDRLRPWAVVNAAGYVRVDDAESAAEACYRLNDEAAAALAAACARTGVLFVTYSSDLVFDGRLRRPYVETDCPAPVNVYGASKAAAEERVAAVCPRGLIIRTSAFFGPDDDWNFITAALRTLAEGQAFSAAGDTVVSATYVPDLVEATLDLLLDGESGLWHLANGGALSWAELASEAARLAGLDAAQVVAAPMRDIAGPARRPPYSALGSVRGRLLPALDDALSRYIETAAWQRVAGGDSGTASLSEISDEISRA